MQVLSKLYTWAFNSALAQLEHLCHRQMQTRYISAAFANLSIMFFQSIRNDQFEKNVRDIKHLPYSDCYSEPLSNAAIRLDCSCSLAIELLNVVD